MSDEIDRTVPPIRPSATGGQVTLASAVKKSTAQIVGGSSKQLQAALAEAQAGMSG
jgi:hypothetical protein